MHHLALYSWQHLPKSDSETFSELASFVAYPFLCWGDNIFRPYSDLITAYRHYKCPVGHAVWYIWCVGVCQSNPPKFQWLIQGPASPPPPPPPPLCFFITLFSSLLTCCRYVATPGLAWPPQLVIPCVA